MPSLWRLPQLTSQNFLSKRRGIPIGSPWGLPEQTFEDFLGKFMETFRVINWELLCQTFGNFYIKPQGGFFNKSLKTPKPLGTSGQASVDFLNFLSKPHGIPIGSLLGLPEQTLEDFLETFSIINWELLWQTFGDFYIEPLETSRGSLGGLPAHSFGDFQRKPSTTSIKNFRIFLNRAFKDFQSKSLFPEHVSRDLQRKPLKLFELVLYGFL